MEKYMQMLQDGGADRAIAIDVRTVVTAPWVTHKCKFGCASFGKSHCCPPQTPDHHQMQEILACFERGILFRCHTMADVTPLAVQVARELFLDGYYRALAFGSGPCKKCKDCEPSRCNFPKETAPSMEACAVDVFATVRNNGLEIHTLRSREEPQNYFGLLLVD